MSQPEVVAEVVIEAAVTVSKNKISIHGRGHRASICDEVYF